MESLKNGCIKKPALPNGTPHAPPKNRNPICQNRQANGIPE